MIPAPRRPPALTWDDLRGRRVGLWGLGVEGHANLRALRARGQEPEVIVDDRAGAGAGAGAGASDDGDVEVIATGAGGLDALLRCDVVVKTPGISRYRPEVARLDDADVPVLGGLGLWLSGIENDRVVCVTGTKGKSTTTAIAGHLLTSLGYRVRIGGNLGRPPHDPGPGIEQPEPDASGGPLHWVVEVSSFQATDVATSPPVVAVTSLHPDHLDWHAGDPEAYYRDKLSLCRQPGAALTIADAGSPLLRARRSLLGPEVDWIAPGPGQPDRWDEPLGLLGAHNRLNAAIARRCLAALSIPEADDPGVLADAAAGFDGLESRLRVVARAGEVVLVDDSLSTNVLAALAAVDAFADRRVALIAGGFDRGIDYAPLANGLADGLEAGLGPGVDGRAREVLVCTIGDAGARITDAVRARGDERVQARPCDDLRRAVELAMSWATPDGVVLLSPAAPSFGEFRDYRERARCFLDAALALGASPTIDS